jgi:hypothetical protein
MHVQKLNYQAENQSVYSDDVVLPHHVIYGVHALVYVLASTRISKLVYEIVAKFSEMSRQWPGSYSLKNPEFFCQNQIYQCSILNYL